MKTTIKPLAFNVKCLKSRKHSQIFPTQNTLDAFVCFAGCQVSNTQAAGYICEAEVHYELVGRLTKLVASRAALGLGSEAWGDGAEEGWREPRNRRRG